MSYNIAAIPNFKRELKKLAKKFPSLKDDFAKLLESLQEDPEQGTALGNNCYKIRMAITSKGKGKSGEVQGLSLMCMFYKLPFTCSPSTTNPTKKISPTKN